MNEHLKRALELIFVPIAAAIVFIEQTLIRYLNVATAALARLPWIARLEAWLVQLPPYWGLLAFVAPSILILPIKIVAVWFVAERKFALAMASLLVGKVLATAIVARLYAILRPNLMTIRWFAWGDSHFFYWRDRAYAFVTSLPAWRSAAERIERLRVWIMELVSDSAAR